MKKRTTAVVAVLVVALAAAAVYLGIASTAAERYEREIGKHRFGD